ncbi:MAG: CRISPR-associated endonuclease Cas2, partial [Deferribacteraceae bacterium]|nr:CRISPR-associated endonuclease Cas2 [Deferribacteraceae bacterium]
MTVDNIIGELTEQASTGKTGSFFVPVIYDVTDNKRRNKLCKLLSSYGERVQKSAFECWITKREQAELEAEALKIIDEAEDSLII